MSEKTTSAQQVATLNPEAFEAFAAAPEKGPVVMLNLLKFKPEGGFEKYMEYGAGATPLVAGVGGRILFTGLPDLLLIGDEDWDMCALVEYPSRGAFLEMVASADYQAVAPLRQQAITRSVLYAMDPAPQA